MRFPTVSDFEQSLFSICFGKLIDCFISSFFVVPRGNIPSLRSGGYAVGVPPASAHIFIVLGGLCPLNPRVFPSEIIILFVLVIGFQDSETIPFNRESPTFL